MYDELVKRLREHNGWALNETLDEAADAIEELICEVAEEHNGRLDAEEKIPSWIPVTERLPEHGWYLAYGPTIKMEVLHFHSVEEVWSSERYYNIEVTHWIPLPEPPNCGAKMTEEGE